MKVQELFDCAYGHGLSLNNLTRLDGPGGVNFVSRTTRNNGVSARVARIEHVVPFTGGLITVPLNGEGGALFACLQPTPFYTAFHIMVLTPRKSMSVSEKLWWALCIRANHFRYGFGRQANRSLTDLELPDDAPSWVSDVPLPDFDTLAGPALEGALPALGQAQWREFSYDEVFVLERGERVIKRELHPGDVPYIRSTAMNNGISAYGELPPRQGNAITVSANGSVGEAFYQPGPFFASDDIVILRPKFSLDPFVAVFLCGLIRRERWRFSYGRKWFSERMRASRIRLPVTPAGAVDVQFMGEYIKHLPYSGTVA